MSNTLVVKKLRKFFKGRDGKLVIVIVVMLFVFQILNPNYITFDNFKDMFKSNTLVLLLSLGMTLIIITGGIDVACTAMCAANAMVFGRLIAYWGQNMLVGVISALLIGAIFGLINGLLITKAKIPPIIATLGMKGIISGGILVCTGGKDQWINATDFPNWFKDFGSKDILMVPVQIWIVIFMIIVTWFILKYTLIGRSVYALGGNQTAAKRTGVNVVWTVIFVYVFMGLLTGIGVITHVSTLVMVDPNGYIGYEMKAICAVILGGGSLIGGVGTTRGTMIGAIFMIMLSNGLALATVSTNWRDIAIGVVMVAAVAIESVTRIKRINSMHKIDVIE